MFRFRSALVPCVATVLFGGCWGTDETGSDYGDVEVATSQDDDADPYWVDFDEDGHYADEDCNDQDPAIHPGADEICDGIDNDCDGTVDGDDVEDPLTFYRDLDGDGYGDESSPSTACTVPDGYVPEAGDCNDDDADVHPGREEACGDGVDNDCDGVVDDYEPNDTFQQAVWVADNDEAIEFEAWSGDGTPDVWAVYADDDWEADFDLMDDFYVYAEFTHVPLGTELGLALYNPQGELVASDQNGVVGASVYFEGFYNSDEGGFYYVDVTVLSGGTCGDVYRLHIENRY